MVGIGSSCGACKFLRRKCEDNCIFSPYFGYDHAESHFAAVHKVFGASNVSKLLAHLPICSRSAAAATVSYEAQARIRDPVRGCVSHILALQQQVASLQEEIESLTKRMVSRSITESMVCGSSDNAGEFEPRPQKIQPRYKEAMDRVGDCLFNTHEHSSCEELAMYLSELERDLLY